LSTAGSFSGHEFLQVAGGKGGKGGNQAMAAARIGARVAMVRCVGKDANGAYLLLEGGEGRHFPALQVRAVDTTAAGDTFIGVFAAQLAARQLLLEDATSLAQRAAAISVTRTGAQPSIPTRAEVDNGG
jgi:sugar/nucleoside kinase (ribokinase family)